jgi:two-component system nitrate/nitrite response regulator NarL
VKSLVVVSEVRLYREGLARLVGNAIESATVRTTGSGEGALGLLEVESAEVVLLDLSLPAALEVARRVQAAFPAVKVVGLGVQDEDEQIVACAEVGIAGLVSRSGSTEDLIVAIECAAAGELSCSKRAAGALLARVAALAGSAQRAPEEVPLTQREIQVVKLVDEGLTNKEIAAHLHISTATARNHVHNILDRLGVRTRSKAAAVARRLLAQA